MDGRRQERDAVLGRVEKYPVNEPQPLWRRMLAWPTAKHVCAARGFDTPELRTAHSTGGPERLDLGWLEIGRVLANDCLYVA